jgi:hypothetical protein
MYIPTGQMTQSIQQKQCWNGFRTRMWKSLRPPAKAQTWIPLKMCGKIWRSLFTATLHLTELEKICREEWEKIPKYRWVCLYQLCTRRLKAVIITKGASTKYWLQGVNTYVN